MSPQLVVGECSVRHYRSEVGCSKQRPLLDQNYRTKTVNHGPLRTFVQNFLSQHSISKVDIHRCSMEISLDCLQCRQISLFERRQTSKSRQSSDPCSRRRYSTIVQSYFFLFADKHGLSNYFCLFYCDSRCEADTICD